LIKIGERPHLGEVFRTLAKQKECNIEDGHLLPDYVHILTSIPPKYSVAQMAGYIKGKSAIPHRQDVPRAISCAT
jgi:putative transposase